MTCASKSYAHRGGQEPLLGITIPERFTQIVHRFPDAEAAVSLPQNKRLTYSQLAVAVDDVALGLLSAGFSSGDRVAIWSTNNIEWLLLQMATAATGVILVDINPAYQVPELEFALQRSEVQGIFLIPGFRSSDYIEMLAELVPEVREAAPHHLQSKTFPFLRRIVLYDPTQPLATERPFSGISTWQEILERGSAFSQETFDDVTHSLDSDDPINIQYTSGTTGFPKAAVLSHRNILNNAYFSAQAMHFTEQDRLCVPLPFYHCFGMVIANLLCVSVGACIVIPVEHFEVVPVLRAIEQERCTAIHGVPTMFIAELEHPQFNEFDLSSLRTGIMAGAPCPPELVTRVMKDMHCEEILIGYGQTEASPLTHLTSRDDSRERRTETVGTNLPYQEVKVVNTQTRRIVQHDEVGEVCFRGYHVMKGYYGDPNATADAIDEDGWLHSGDLGTMDGDGYVRITGRLKDMLIRGGENIYPSEIEAIIFTHPNVAQVSVFGVPDEFYGEQVMAWIQLHTGQETTEDDIREFCKGKMAHFKIPSYVSFVEAFPMTVTGKLQKFKMREMAISSMALHTDAKT